MIAKGFLAPKSRCVARHPYGVQRKLLMESPALSRVYVIFRRTRCCIRIYTDLDRHAFQAALKESLERKKSLFLHVYQPNGNGYVRSHTTVTPYEILVDCVFHVQDVSNNGGDPCTDKGKEARFLERLFREHGLT